MCLCSTYTGRISTVADLADPGKKYETLPQKLLKQKGMMMWLK
jgi:hypothetical protein